MLRGLLPILTAFASGELHDGVRRAKRNVIFYAVMAFFGLIVVAFALVAAQIFLAGVYGALAAALIIAGIALIILIIVLVAMRIVIARDRRRARERRNANTSLYTTAALTLMPYMFRSRATLLLGVPLAAIAGYFLLGGRGGGEEE